MKDRGVEGTNPRGQGRGQDGLCPGLCGFGFLARTCCGVGNKWTGLGQQTSLGRSSQGLCRLTCQMTSSWVGEYTLGGFKRVGWLCLAVVPYGPELGPQMLSLWKTLAEPLSHQREWQCKVSARKCVLKYALHPSHVVEKDRVADAGAAYFLTPPPRVAPPPLPRQAARHAVRVQPRLHGGVPLPAAPRPREAGLSGNTRDPMGGPPPSWWVGQGSDPPPPPSLPTFLMRQFLGRDFPTTSMPKESFVVRCCDGGGGEPPHSPGEERLGIVENVVLMGACVTNDRLKWQHVKKAVAGVRLECTHVSPCIFCAFSHAGKSFFIFIFQK